MPRRLQWLCCSGALCLLSAGFANEPSPANVAITSRLALKGDSFVHLRNQESKTIILEVSPGPLSGVQFAAKRVTLNPGAAADINLGTLGFQLGRQRLHIISKLFDSQNAPAGMGPYLLESLIVSATEIRKISDEDASLSPRKPAPDTSQQGGPAYGTVPADVPLSVSPTSLRITGGKSADYAVVISPSSSFEADVRLSVSGLPQGTTARFKPNPATLKSILTVKVTETAKPGTYPLTVSVANSSVTLSATVTLSIP